LYFVEELTIDKAEKSENIIMFVKLI
jgi:hypothetical protein